MNEREADDDDGQAGDEDDDDRVVHEERRQVQGERVTSSAPSSDLVSLTPVGLVSPAYLRHFEASRPAAHMHTHAHSRNRGNTIKGGAE